MQLDHDDISRLRSLPLRIYSPSSGGGRAWAPLITAGLVSVLDVGSDEMQETILALEITAAGRKALASAERSPRKDAP